MESTRKRPRRRGPGRPPLPLGVKADAVVFVRLRPVELAALRRVAKRAGTTPALLARDLIRRHLAKH